MNQIKNINLTKNIKLKNTSFNTQNLKLPPITNKINTPNIEELTFDDTLEDKKFPEITSDNYIVQGITTTDNEILISAYTNELNDLGQKQNSKIYIYNKETNDFKGEILLNNNAHVGGLAIDKENNILYVTGNNGKINTYSYNNIIRNLRYVDKIDLNYEYLSDCIIPNNISVQDLTQVGTASTICLKDEYLYVATFSGTKNGELVKLKLNYSNNEITTKSVSSPIDIPKLTQGIEIVNEDNKEYLLTTESVGLAKSIIRLFEIKDDKLNEIGIKQLPEKGIEGINVDENYNVIYSYENEYENKDYNATTTTFQALKKEIEENNEKISISQQIIRTLGGTIYELSKK